jgi:hypothetical protein
MRKPSQLGEGQNKEEGNICGDISQAGTRNYETRKETIPIN